MARKKIKKPPKEGAAWLITFSDMMTLMLTFFVLLVSMSTMDERRKLVVLGSIIGTFGMGQAGYDARTLKDKKTTVEPGPMNDERAMDTLKDLLWDDPEKDLDFRSNKYVQIISISDRVLFSPGQTQLSEEGIKVIDRVLPVLLRLKHPILLAGHSASGFDENPDLHSVDLSLTNKKGLDDSWKMSLNRVLSIYQYLLSRGIDSKMMRVEAFGIFRPRFSQATPRGRSRNRRVDIVLDKRNKKYLEKLGEKKEKYDNSKFKYKGFIFDATRPDTRKEDMAE